MMPISKLISVISFSKKGKISLVIWIFRAAEQRTIIQQYDDWYTVPNVTNSTHQRPVYQLHSL